MYEWRYVSHVVEAKSIENEDFFVEEKKLQLDIPRIEAVAIASKCFKHFLNAF